MKSVLIKLPDINFTKFIKSDVALTNEDMYKEAKGDYEENKGLLAEEKFGSFLNKNLSNKQHDVTKKRVIKTSHGATWEGLERQPNFKCMQAFSIIYTLLSTGVNCYIFIF